MTREDVNAALDRVKSWSIEKQAELAEFIELMEAQQGPLEEENEALRALLAERLAEAQREEFASVAAVEAAYARFR